LGIEELVADCVVARPSGKPSGCRIEIRLDACFEPSEKFQRASRRFSTPVAVGTAVTHCPPHRPVLALLTHTVLTLDEGMFGVETLGRIRVQDLDWR
jgi:hypothetical protein